MKHKKPNLSTNTIVRSSQHNAMLVYGWAPESPGLANNNLGFLPAGLYGDPQGYPGSPLLYAGVSRWHICVYRCMFWGRHMPFCSRTHKCTAVTLVFELDRTGVV